MLRVSANTAEQLTDWKLIISSLFTLRQIWNFLLITAFAYVTIITLRRMAVFGPTRADECKPLLRMSKYNKCAHLCAICRR